MRLFYCNNALSHILHTSTSDSIFRAQAINLSIKDTQNTQRLIGVDLFNSTSLVMCLGYFVPCHLSAFGFSPPLTLDGVLKANGKTRSATATYSEMAVGFIVLH